MTLTIKFFEPQSRSARATTAAAALWRLFGWPSRVLAARRVMRQLGALSDCELKDIGLYRQDLRDASGLPPDVDPSLMLRRKVETRRPQR
ncbi:MAG TPA: DUF1127 domain-containing protein [Lichenihabitans sp.]|jgi:uncharacterized protein YjiS (DUF1127 family)|nr:DUF1127 domain-containing protein [Lichenihabitans sp.]